MPNSEGILRLKNHRNKYHEYDILDPDVMAAYQKSVDDADEEYRKEWEDWNRKNKHGKQQKYIKTKARKTGGIS